AEPYGADAEAAPAARDLALDRVDEALSSGRREQREAHRSLHGVALVGPWHRAEPLGVREERVDYVLAGAGARDVVACRGEDRFVAHGRRLRVAALSQLVFFSLLYRTNATRAPTARAARTSMKWCECRRCLMVGDQ